MWHPDGYLLFSDIPAAIIYRYDPGAAPVPWRRDSGNSNGLTYDRQGRLLACEHGNRRVSRTEADGTVTAAGRRTMRAAASTAPMTWWCAAMARCIFTDPPYGIKPEQQEQPCNGVYRVSPDGRAAPAGGRLWTGPMAWPFRPTSARSTWMTRRAA